MIPSLPAGYSVRFADDGHQPINNWDDFTKRCGGAALGLYFRGTLVATGILSGGGKPDVKHRVVSTHCMSCVKVFRRKGHGIWLYIAMIRAAKSLGAETIYSSWYLNRHSRRMWRDKLSKLFPVRQRGGCRHCGRSRRFLIQLKEQSC